MSIKKENICRLCFKVRENQFKTDKIVRQIFEILLIKLDLGITRNPTVCQDCMEVAKNCLNFKYTCLNTEEIILSYSTHRKKVISDIRVIFEERKYIETTFDEDLHICRFCMMRRERNNFVSLNAVMNERMSEMSEYMPEMDFDIIENPIICGNCKENLDSYFKFVLICVDAEEKIKAYCEKYGTDKAGEVKLSNVQVFMFRDIKYPNKCSQTCESQQDHIDCAYKELIKLEELGIKDEEMILNEKINRPPICTDETRERKNGKNDKKDNTDVLQLDVYEGISCTTEINLQDVSKGYVNKCGGVSKPKQTQMLMQKRTSHSAVFKCSWCAYECKYKSTLNRHVVIHKNTSEIEMVKCLLCGFESKHKNSLKAHMSIHKDLSETEMFMCSLCGYKCKRKRYLKTHMLVHKDVSEIQMFKCSLCTYKYKHKNSLKKHMLLHKNHKDVLETKTFKCSLCAYESKHKSNLKAHMLVHKDVSQLKMFKCLLCAKEFKFKSSLKTHMLLHKDVSEIKMYKCSLCPFEAKQKGNLKSHMLIHEDVSEIKMSKRSLCTFESKHKRSLNTHVGS